MQQLTCIPTPSTLQDPTGYSSAGYSSASIRLPWTDLLVVYSLASLVGKEPGGLARQRFLKFGEYPYFLVCFIFESPLTRPYRCSILHRRNNTANTQSFWIPDGITRHSFSLPKAERDITLSTFVPFCFLYVSAYQEVSCAPKGEHSYLLSNQLGRVSMFAKTYRNDGLPMEASLQNLKIVGCTYSLAREALSYLPIQK